jgi:hypothetical protein
MEGNNILYWSRPSGFGMLGVIVCRKKICLSATSDIALAGVDAATLARLRIIGSKGPGCSLRKDWSAEGVEVEVEVEDE